MRKSVSKNRFMLWVFLGVLLGSFIPDPYSPLAIIKKFNKK